FQFLARATSLEQLDAISGDRIFLFQLSDFGSELTDPMETAHHRRVFPGEGSNGAAIVGLIERAAAAGYGGDYTIDVFNDEYLPHKRETPPHNSIHYYVNAYSAADR